MNQFHLGSVLLELYSKWLDFSSPYIKIDSPREWHAHYGVSPLAFERNSNICDVVKPKHLLMTMNFLEVYSLGDIAHHCWGSKRSWTDHVWRTLDHLYENLDTRFHWSDRHLFGRVGPVMGVVDGTSCEIQRPCDQFAQWVFSDEKHKMFADKYQVITHVVNGIILNHIGPWPGSVHEIEMLRQSGILESLTQCEALLGDKGYQGEAELITPFSCPISIGKIRQPVKHGFPKVKKIGCLKQMCRHSLNRHCKAFHVCCEAINSDTL